MPSRSDFPYWLTAKRSKNPELAARHGAVCRMLEVTTRDYQYGPVLCEFADGAQLTVPRHSLRRRT